MQILPKIFILPDCLNSRHGCLQITVMIILRIALAKHLLSKILSLCEFIILMDLTCDLIRILTSNEISLWILLFDMFHKCSRCFFYKSTVALNSKLKFFKFRKLRKLFWSTITLYGFNVLN